MFSESTSSQAKAPKEFQAVILAGQGQDLSPLTSADMPKALLPVGNKPLLEGVLNWVEEAQLLDVLLLAPRRQEGELSAFVRSRRASSDSELRIDLEAYDEEDEGIKGTAGVLRCVERLIQYDPIILPCDLCLIPSTSNPNSPTNALLNLLDVHRLNHNLLTCLFYERAASNEEKGKEGPAPVLSVIEPSANILLDYKDVADFDDEIELRASLLTKYQRALLTTALMPAHVYVCSLRALKILEAIPAFHSFKEDVVPFLCKLQWQSTLLQKYSDSSVLRPLPNSQSLALSCSSTQTPLLPAQETAGARSPQLPSFKRPALRTLLTRTSAQDLKSTSSDPQVGVHLRDVACCLRVWRRADGFCSRANTVEALHEIHRVTLPILAAAHKQANPNAQLQTRQIGSDSIIGANLIVGEKSTIKKSSIGKNVQIGKDCKVSASILMDGVVLGDSVKLDGCIVCPYSRIGDGSNLSKCELAFKCEVAANSRCSGRVHCGELDRVL